MNKQTEEKKRIVVVLGTRPEAIKMAPLIIELRNNPYYKVVVVSTGQHRETMKSILEFFEIIPDIDLDILKNGQSVVDVCTSVFKGLDKSLAGISCSGIFVQGDTASCFSAATWGFLNQVPVFHIEAGLRTGNLKSPWPEEFNRKATSLASTLHFAATEASALNLLKEGILSEAIFVVGNTVVDTLMRTSNTIDKSPALLNQLASEFPFLDPKKKLLLVTVHRRESFGKEIENIFTAVKLLSEREDVQVVLPLHLNPNVRDAAKAILREDSKVHVVEPLSYISFVYIMKNSTLILSDSGGVQEEAPSLGKPVLVLRNTTERQESVDSGTCRLVGTQTLDIIREAEFLLHNEAEINKAKTVKNPYGVGDSSEKVVKIINRFFGFEPPISSICDPSQSRLSSLNKYLR